MRVAVAPHKRFFREQGCLALRKDVSPDDPGLKFRRSKRKSRFHRLRNATLELARSIAPWSLGAALLVSFTASAGQTTQVIDLGFRRSAMIEPERLTLMPPRLMTLNTVALPTPDIVDGEAKTNLGAILPHIRKVDLQREMERPRASGMPMLFETDRALLPDRKLQPAVTMMRASEVLMARLNRFDSRGQTPGSGSTGQGTSPQALAFSRPDGATPAVPRATRLASVTPAPVEPELIVSAGTRIPAFAQVHSDASGQQTGTATLRVSRGYLDLIDPESLKREQKCLAEAIYFESRSEPESGQAAVAQVVLNRVRSGLYPTTVCGVVYQNRHRYKACQFTFACEGKSLAVTEPGPWAIAQRVAKAVLEGQSYNKAVGASTHYHATYVAPYWSRKLKRTDQIGRHIFYRLRPGQT